MMPMPVIVLQPSLTDDVHSRIHFSNWKKSLATAAQSLCRSLDDCGAYSLVSDDPEWQSHPTNIITTTSAAGNITIAHRARPVITRPVIYSGNEKRTAIINLFNYKELQWKEWTAASMALHQAMINSIGALNLATIERLSGHAGIISLSCRQLLVHITTIFGTLHATDVFFIENHIKEELTSFATFRDFISRNSLNYDILAQIPHQISDITKIHWLENSLQRCPQFDTPIATWKSLNTTVATRTYNDLILYLSAQYSSLSPDTPSRGGQAFNASSNTTNNDGSGRNRKRRRGRGRGRNDTVQRKGGGPNDNGQNKRQRQQKEQALTASAAAVDPDISYRNGWEEDLPSTAMAGQLHEWTNTPSVSSTGSDIRTRAPQPKTADHRFYCAVHGYNITHNGSNCRIMLRDKHVYNQKHLQAKQPGDCANPAGNDNIQYLPPRLH